MDGIFLQIEIEAFISEKCMLTPHSKCSWHHFLFGYQALAKFCLLHIVLNRAILRQLFLYCYFLEEGSSGNSTSVVIREGSAFIIINSLHASRRIRPTHSLTNILGSVLPPWLHSDFSTLPCVSPSQQSLSKWSLVSLSPFVLLESTLML